jgi:hypothetical protein
VPSGLQLIVTLVTSRLHTEQAPGVGVSDGVRVSVGVLVMVGVFV